MFVVGIDLAGPGNAENTAVVAFRQQGDALQLAETLLGADDKAILEGFLRWNAGSKVVAGLDAPLSYNAGGGDRPGDARLRKAGIAAGLRPGSVMTPLFNRMVYLTLRGIAVARLLQSLTPNPPAIVEVHPGVTLALRGAPITDVLALKQSSDARQRLLVWLEQQGLQGASRLEGANDHCVMACAAALAAWKWASGQAVWIKRAIPPFHPFDFAC